MMTPLFRTIKPAFPTVPIAPITSADRIRVDWVGGRLVGTLLIHPVKAVRRTVSDFVSVGVVRV